MSSRNNLLVVFECVFSFFIHLSYHDHTVSNTVTHNFSLFISFHMSDTVTYDFLFAHWHVPCQSHRTQVLTCHRLGCDLDVTRLPGIVLSQRGSSQQGALKILSDVITICSFVNLFSFVCMLSREMSGECLSRGCLCGCLGVSGGVL